MQEVGSSQKQQPKINRQVESHHDSNYQFRHQKKIAFADNSQQILNTKNKKQSQEQIAGNKCYFPQFLKQEMLRLFFIPLLIVLFLLTIALTFKQNNYQTNDYFYSKNIQINRKIRGVVPPLNETKQDIFGEYRIGLVQYFSVEDRRMLQDFKVQMWRNESMRVTQIEKEDKCWSVYKLKFYSSTIFIEKKESHFMNVTVISHNVTIQKSNNTLGKIKNDTNSTQSIQKSFSETTVNQSSNLSNSKAADIQSVLPQPQAQSSQQQSSLQTSQTPTTSVQQPLCQLQKWSRLNQILGNSHIWTFAQGNFYLMEFSQIQQDNNGVLIMKMIDQYPSNV